MQDGITATDQRNVEGRAQAMTVMTPIKRFWTWKVRLAFLLVGWIPALSEPLRVLSFIHYARWNIVDEIPFNGGTQKRERLHYKYLLFTTNFNGTWEQYIDAFSRYCPDKMDLIWGTSFGHPGAAHTKKFKEYIRFNEFPASHYYSAYPSFPTTVINQSLSLEEKFQAFQARTATLGPEEFQAEYLAFLTDIQRLI